MCGGIWGKKGGEERGRGRELTAQGGGAPAEVDDGAVAVLARVWAVTSTDRVEVRRRR